MTTAEHLVVLDVMAAEGQAVPTDVLRFTHGDDVFMAALWHGPLHERYVFPEGGRPHAEVYYAGWRATTDRPWGVFESGPRPVQTLG